MFKYLAIIFGLWKLKRVVNNFKSPEYIWLYEVIIKKQSIPENNENTISFCLLAYLFSIFV